MMYTLVEEASVYETEVKMTAKRQDENIYDDEANVVDEPNVHNSAKISDSIHDFSAILTDKNRENKTHD